MVNIYTTELTPRMEYSFRLIFEILLKDEIQFFQNVHEFQESNGIKINYSKQSEIGGFHIKPQGLLSESHLQMQHPATVEWEGIIAFFPVENSFLPFDIFAASFYLVSRYEEYLPGKRDRHQRFRARESFAAMNSFLEKPIVNIWALKLAEKIEQNVPDYRFKRTKFKYIPTIDIDNAWAFKNKGFVRITLSMVKDILKGRFKVFRKRFAVVNRLEKDPYDNYDFLSDILKTFQFRPVFFFLLNKKGKYDRSLSHKNLYYRSLILQLAKQGKVGIHPSYVSNNSKKQLHTEIERLKSITGKKVKRSRQHFLKITMPATFRNLIEQGINADYSMGFASRPGFRAGIASSYYFFDVIKNKATELKIYPFQVMDVTLKDYRGFGVNDASKKIEQLMQETAKVGGTFISLWHNESLSDEGHWKGWRNVYSEMTRLAAELRNEHTTAAQ